MPIQWATPEQRVKRAIMRSTNGRAQATRKVTVAVENTLLSFESKIRHRHLVQPWNPAVDGLPKAPSPAT
jgi:hypothetical protein